MKKLYAGYCVLTALLVFAMSLQGWAKTEGEAFDFRKGFSSVAAKATPAVVFIQVEKQVPVGNMQFFNNPFDLFGEDFSERFFGEQNGRANPYHRRQPGRGRQQMYKQTGQGSGFIISKDGYILTNTHVVGDVDKITVRLADGREFAAKRIGADPKTEVALIKIESKDDLPVIAIGNPDSLLIGEWVIAIGNPFGLKETLTVGVVSAKGRSNIGITDYEDFIQTDAAINPGNSGGPLLNIDGEVVGINTAIFSRSGGYMGIGFAVPIDMAMNIKSQLVANGKVTRGYIGVVINPGDVTEEMAKSFGRGEAGGVLIADVQKDGPADKAGIKSGDIFVEFDGKKIKDSTSFRNDVARILPNKKAEITLFRDGKSKKVTVTVGTFPDEEAAAAGGTQEGGDIAEKLGFEVQDLTPEVAEQLGYEEKRGVVISDVDPNSAAYEQGLRTGMLILEVNRSEVKNVSDFEKAAGKVKGGNMLLRIKMKEGSIFLHLRAND